MERGLTKMASNSKLMGLINDAEDNYGKPSNWPEKVTEKINAELGNATQISPSLTRTASLWQSSQRMN